MEGAWAFCTVYSSLLVYDKAINGVEHLAVMNLLEPNGGGGMSVGLFYCLILTACL